MQVEEQEGKYICLKHNQEVKMVVLDEEAPLSDLLLCDTCLDKNSYPYRMVRVNFAKQKIKERLGHEGNPEPLEIQMKKLKNLIELRNQLLKTIDEILSNLG